MKFRGSHYLASLLGTLTFASGQWLIVVVLTRVTSVTNVGTYAFAMAVATPAVMLLGLGLRTVLVADPQREERFAEYHRLRMLTTMAAVVAIGLLSFVRADLGLIGVTVVLTKGVDAIGDIFMGLQQSRQRFWRIAAAQSLNGLGSPLLVLAGYLLTSDVIFALFCASIPSAAAAIFLASTSKEQRTQRRRSPSAASMARLAWQAVPLGLASAMIALNAALPRYVLNHVGATEALGVFAAISYISTAGLLATSAVAQVLLPRFVHQVTAGHHDLLVRQVALLAAAPVVLSGMLAMTAPWLGPPFLRLLYGPKYVDVPTFAILLIALGVGTASWVVDMLLASMQGYRYQLIAGSIALAVGTPVTLLLVSKGTAASAAAATLALSVVHLGARAALIRRARATSLRPVTPSIEG